MKRVLLTAAIAVIILSITDKPAGAADFSKLFKKVKPSVVVIMTIERGTSMGSSGETTMPGFGSGFIISKDGLIITAAHVVQMADVVNVKLHDGKIFSATIKGTVSAADVALIKLDHAPKDLVPATLGDSDKAMVGEEVFVIGSPYDIEYTLTTGHISGRRKPGELSNHMVLSEFIQTDAAINKGNSGGPLFNTKGEVIGIVSHIITESGGFQGLGFASTIKTAKTFLIDQSPFWAGIDAVLLTGDQAEALNIPQDTGYLVQRVALNSLGSRLGLRTGDVPVSFGLHEMMLGGDIILEIQGIPVSSGLEERKEIRKALSGIPDDGEINVRVLRAGKVVVLSAVKATKQ